MTLTLDLLILKVVSESRVTCATSVPILVFLGLSVLELGPMYATDVAGSDIQSSDRQMSDRRQTASSLNAPPRGPGIISKLPKREYCSRPAAKYPLPSWMS